MEKMFEPVSSMDGEENEMSDYEEEEESEEEVDDVMSENVDFGKCAIKARPLKTIYKYALGNALVNKYEKIIDEEAQDSQVAVEDLDPIFKENTIKRELSEELMDYIETEYFAGALYELL